MYAAVHVRTHAFAGAHRYTHAPKRTPTAPHPPPRTREGRTIHAHTHHPAPQTTTAPHQWRHTEALRSDSKRITNPLGVSVPHERRKSFKTAENSLVYTYTHTHARTPGSGRTYTRTPMRTPVRSGTPTPARLRSLVRPPACTPTHTHEYKKILLTPC